MPLVELDVRFGDELRHIITKLGGIRASTVGLVLTFLRATREAGKGVIKLAGARAVGASTSPTCVDSQSREANKISIGY